MRICVRGSELLLRPARTPAVRPAVLRTPKGDRRTRDRHFPAQLHLPHLLTSAKMAAPTAMCNIETLNGREYKVKDMAMADFGCVRRRALLREKSPKRRDRATRRFAASPRRRPRRPRATSRRARPPGNDGFTRGSERGTRVGASFPRQPPASTLPSAADRAPCPETPSTVASRSSSRRSRCPVSCP